MKDARRWLSLALLAPLLLFILPTQAGGLLSIQSENNSWAGTEDGHFTNGSEIRWIFPPVESHWTNGLAALLPGWTANDVDQAAYRLGHQIYTPINLSATSLQEDDRPYAGLLYAGLSLANSQTHEGWRESRGLHLDLGLVGPVAGAAKTQRYFHRFIAGDEPRGWSHQLNNEPIIAIGYEHAWLKQGHWGGMELEYGPTTGFSLGNLFTYATAGITMRYGKGLDTTYNITSIDPAQDVQIFGQSGGKFRWYVFAGLEGRYMAHNLLLDGNSYTASHSVEREPWVGDAKAGFAFEWDRWQMTYTMIWRSEEFSQQEHPDRFGSLSLSLRL
ncbi:MAG TPA: lipid A deacylase LpxR family protein [Guyparkeria sp.]|nr:lipid A deacylase LpxR family protein [Guyparkeria sp.]